MLSFSYRSNIARVNLRSAGFSLIEMAVVMLIVGLLLNGLFVALGDTAVSRNRSAATTELESITEAMYGHAQTTGRLPCPALVTSAGVEAPNGGGVCTSAHGFVPATTLGIQGSIDTNGLLLDPWGNPYRYSVSVLASGGNRVFTSVAGMQSQFAVGALPVNNNLICIAGAIACGAPVYANSVPALVYSMGADWASFTSALQLENANSVVAGFRMASNNDFANSDYSEEGANAFDDILVWIPPNILFSRMISAGKLP